MVSTHWDINHILYVGKLQNTNRSFSSDFQPHEDFPLVGKGLCINSATCAWVNILLREKYMWLIHVSIARQSQRKHDQTSISRCPRAIHVCNYVRNFPTSKMSKFFILCRQHKAGFFGNSELLKRVKRSAHQTLSGADPTPPHLSNTNGSLQMWPKHKF